MAKEDSFHVAILIEAEKRMIASALEVAVVGRPFLIAIGRADRAVHIKDDLLEWPAFVNPVHRDAGQVHQELKILGLSQCLCFKSAHCTG